MLGKSPDYAQVPAVKPVPRLTDWSTLTPERFAATYADQPVIFQGLSTRWPAYKKWTREFLVDTIGADTLVEVRRPIALGSTQQQWAAKVPVRIFAEEVETVPGLYLAEWYPYEHRPQLLADIGPVPSFLDEDWLSSIPDEQFSTTHRMPIYWGGTDSATDCHFDQSNTVTWNACFKGIKRWFLFSGRSFPERTWERKRAAQRLVRSGLASPMNHTEKSSGFVTLEGIERYTAGKLPDLPANITFYWADVGAGDVIYVPWRWFHQVHNVTESIALSRYYVARENYQAYIAFMRDISRTGTVTVRILMGSERTRRLVGSEGARRAWSHGVGKALVSRALRLTGVNP
jgi:hypothetical protein